MRYVHLDILRAFAILSIVFFHTTGMLYANHFPDSKETYSSLYFVFNQCYLVNFAMVVFTALSGYLFMLLYNMGKYHSKKTFILKKIKRLLLPFVVFTILIAFTQDFTNKTIAECTMLCLKSFLRGSFGHLWYLPGLFWCFVLAIFLAHSFKGNKMVQLSIFVISIATALLFNDIEQNLLGLLHGIRWFFFFYMGMLLAEYHNLLQKKLSLHILLLILTIALCIIHPFPPYADRDIILMLTLSISLFPLFFLTENFFGDTLLSGVKAISKYSYGIYIFHCWIAPFLVSTTAQRLFHLAPICQQHTFAFPMMLFCATFILSFMATYFLQKSKIGKYLLG